VFAACLWAAKPHDVAVAEDRGRPSVTTLPASDSRVP
jgi:hypothetical protein